MKNRKLFSILCCLFLSISMVFCLCSCGEEKESYEIGVVIDIGQLMDGGFNQGTYEGAQNYAEKNGKTYKYYQLPNTTEATDNDRISAMRQAVNNGAKVIIAPGYLHESAIRTVAQENPDVKFIFVDGWALGLQNVTAVIYKEEESGYMAGYAAVKDGYTKLGATLGGGGSNPACNRFGFGFVQGAAKAASELDTDIEIKYSYKYGDNFCPSADLETQISSWYSQGTEIVFACGGAMFESVVSAAETTSNGKIIGVDVDQSPINERIVTSAIKGISISVEKILGELFDGEWDTKLANQASCLGAKDNATGIPNHFERFNSFSQSDYDVLFQSISDGTTKISSNVPENCNDEQWLIDATKTNPHVSIIFEK